MLPRAVHQESSEVVQALALAGRDDRLRDALFEALRQAEREAEDPGTFRRAVLWPLVRSLLGEETAHRVVLHNGLIVEVHPDSRIEQALLLSLQARPDHIWEPQTTRLLLALAADAAHVIVGGAYIGDHVLPLAHTLAGRSPPGVVHAFEPMGTAFRRLLRNLELNGLTNVVAYQLGLWDQSGATLSLRGPPALSSSAPASGAGASGAEFVPAVTLADYVASRRLEGVGLIMLDTEGSEERALLGARTLLARPWPDAPHLVFEIHRNYVDWTAGLPNTSIVRLLTGNGYTVYAVRDLHDNYSMAGKAIEIIPVDRVYLEGPPHGFNLLATKDAALVQRLGLRVVEGVSPKLLLDKDPALHGPLDGFR
jgi:FkbM family methyltransferase